MKRLTLIEKEFILIFWWGGVRVTLNEHRTSFCLQIRKEEVIVKPLTKKKNENQPTETFKKLNSFAFFNSFN